ncbi:MAG: hypothetical protein JSS29_14650 [Proteobacteria bacterium]|nr:hypothetical protein [Pseudomonadota bacterium]
MSDEKRGRDAACRADETRVGRESRGGQGVGSQPASTEILPKYSLAEIVENYQLELSCSVCGSRFSRAIGFVRDHARMSCPSCAAITLLDVSEIRREVRHIEKQMAQLHEQLIEALAAGEPASPEEDSLPHFEVQK